MRWLSFVGILLCVMLSACGLEEDNINAITWAIIILIAFVFLIVVLVSGIFIFDAIQTAWRQILVTLLALFLFIIALVIAIEIGGPLGGVIILFSLICIIGGWASLMDRIKKD